MKKIRQTIKEFILSNDQLLIKCNKYELQFDIINGSVNFNFIDELNNVIGLNHINVDDDIIIYFKEQNIRIIKPIKIIKPLKYKFNSESSESSESCESG